MNNEELVPLVKAAFIECISLRTGTEKHGLALKEYEGLLKQLTFTDDLFFELEQFDGNFYAPENARFLILYDMIHGQIEIKHVAEHQAVLTQLPPEELTDEEKIEIKKEMNELWGKMSDDTREFMLK